MKILVSPHSESQYSLLVALFKEMKIEFKSMEQEISQEDKAVLDERIREYEENPQGVKSYDEVRASIKGKYGI